MTVSFRLRPLTRLMGALADERRLAIVGLLSFGELSASQLAEAMVVAEDELAEPLAILGAEGVVEARGENRRTLYALKDQPDADCQRHLQELVQTFAPRDILRGQYERLKAASTAEG